MASYCGIGVSVDAGSPVVGDATAVANRGTLTYHTTDRSAASLCFPYLLGLWAVWLRRDRGVLVRITRIEDRFLQLVLSFNDFILLINKDNTS